MRYRHIVLIRFREEAPVGIAADAEALLRELGLRSEVLEWTIERSVDTRKGLVLVENALFASLDSFHAWRASREHSNVTDLLGQHADWLVGDYYE